MSAPLCHVIPTLGRGGAERQLDMLCRGLQRRGGRVSVVALFEGGPYVDSLEQAGVDVHVLSIPGLWSLGGIRRLAATLDALQPAIVHSWLFDANCMCAAASLVRRGQSARITSRRDIDVWKKHRHVVAERFASRGAGAIVANSRAAGDWARKTERLPAERYHVIYNGVMAVPDGNRNPKPGAPLLCPATLSLKKGQDILLRAVALLRDEGRPVALTLAGDGPMRVEYEALARSLGLDQSTRFLGEQADLLPLYRDSAAMVLASRYESLPNAVLEAMAAGCPVVATRVGGLAEIIESERTGLLVEPEDPAALAAALRHVLDQPAQANEMARRAQLRVAQQFDPETMILEHENLYHSVLLERNPR